MGALATIVRFEGKLGTVMGVVVGARGLIFCRLDASHVAGSRCCASEVVDFTLARCLLSCRSEPPEVAGKQHLFLNTPSGRLFWSAMTESSN